MARHIDETEIISPRLLLRPYRVEDVPLFYQLLLENKERLAPAFPGRIRLMKSLDEARKLLLQFKSDWLLGQVYAFGVWLRDKNQYIGDISLKNFDHSIPKAEIGYYLSSEVEGHGLGVEMLQALIQFAMHELKINKLFIRCSLQNKRSFNLAERCGFRREGIIRNDFRDNNSQLIDIYYYGLTRQDYFELPSSTI